MTALILDLRMDGFTEPIGNLVRDDRGALSFVYRAAHLAHPEAPPLSLSLPLTDEPYGDVITRAFFDNLLQERDVALAQVMAREGLARHDVAGLLLHLGKDCPGAISVVPSGAPPVKTPGDLATDYDPLSDDELAAIVTALRDRRRLPDVAADPSPLAGVQSKIALTVLPDGRFAQPKRGSGAPTTHILKVPNRDHPNDAINEAASLALSRALGVETVEATTMDIGGIMVLVVRRFDRLPDHTGRIARLHQEDFAQALGLPAELKYERRGKPERRFDAAAARRVLDATSDPIGARDAFIGATLFDLIISNVDAHAKNHALLHIGRGNIRLSPRYDLLPTRLDPNLTEEFAFLVGDAAKLDDVTTTDLETFLGIMGVATPAARRRVARRHGTKLAEGLGGALEALQARGMKQFADLIAANLRHVLPLLDVSVPETARNRDAFVARGGGWLNS